MKERFLFKSIVATALLIMILSVGGCSGSVSRSPVYDYYDQVQLGATKDEVNELLGTPTDTDTFFGDEYLDPETGFGVFIFYNDAGQVDVKFLDTEDEEAIWEYYDYAQVQAEQADEISPGLSYNDVSDLLGSEGLEIIEAVDSENTDAIIKSYFWGNEDGSGIMVAFSDDKVTDASFTEADESQSE